MLTHEDIEEILRLLDATPVDELELETEHFKLILRRSASERGGWTQEHETRGEPRVLAAAAEASSAQSAPAPSAPAVAGALEVRAPLLGTFYRSPKPGVAPFVAVGTRVGTNTVVAIIETMKLMNSVYAGVDGQVIEICVADGTAVERDQVLMRLAPPKS
ncbi:MAG TPA: biotin/lipoyl-containing protein [Steroidobacteraceae bacterium]|jgi:acetyl-CoA carboxylase biotin carboxyl carrier protein